jgi:hypothetical protein
MLLIGMTTAFSICVLGLVLGMAYTLFECFFHRHELWSVLNGSIRYYKILGAVGIAGMALFFAFVISLIARKRE